MTQMQAQAGLAILLFAPHICPFGHFCFNPTTRPGKATYPLEMIILEMVGAQMLCPHISTMAVAQYLPHGGTYSPTPLLEAL